MFLPQGYLNSSACCHNQVWSKVELIITQNNLIHYIEDVPVIIFLGEELLERVVRTVVIHMTNKDWSINLPNVQGLAQDLKSRGITWDRTTRKYILPLVLPLINFANKQETDIT